MVRADEVKHDQVAQRCHVERVGERSAGMDGDQRVRNASFHTAPQFFSRCAIERDEVLGPTARASALQFVQPLGVMQVEREELPTAALRPGHRELPEQHLGDQVLPRYVLCRCHTPKCAKRRSSAVKAF
ncbi:hypothetical protein GCM10010423_70400 [Streptomyces levis]|uniref:Uncharacterized protein n=1 Tax=Streptomyces levis TaxID=285566 RepID=A0ABP6BD75_9ACTN